MIDIFAISGRPGSPPPAFEQKPSRHRMTESGPSGRSILSYVSRPATSRPLEFKTPPLSSELTTGTLWDKRLDFKASIEAKLREAGRPDLAKPLSECHKDHFFARCRNCKKTREFWNRCKKVWCPVCQPSIAHNRVDEMQVHIDSLSQPKHVVLTVRNTTILTRSRVKLIRKQFNALLESKFCKNGRRDFVACDVATREPIFRTSTPWRGGLASLEVTKEKRGWHLHIHALVDARFVDNIHLAEEWFKRTKGAGYITKVKDCRDKSYLAEITKYAVKGSDLAKWKAEEIVEFVLAMNKVRSFWTFGTLYGDRSKFKAEIAAVREKGKECECGCTAWQIFDEQEWEWERIKRGALLDIPPPPLPPPATLPLAFV